MMHRANLGEGFDRCSLLFQLEIREPFLDQAIVGYTSELAASAMVAQGGHVRGKVPLRALYDLYPAELPGFIRLSAKDAAL